MAYVQQLLIMKMYRRYVIRSVSHTIRLTLKRNIGIKYSPIFSANIKRGGPQPGYYVQ